MNKYVLMAIQYQMYPETVTVKELREQSNSAASTATAHQVAGVSVASAIAYAAANAVTYAFTAATSAAAVADRVANDTTAYADYTADYLTAAAHSVAKYFEESGENKQDYIDAVNSALLIKAPDADDREVSVLASEWDPDSNDYPPVGLMVNASYIQFEDDDWTDTHPARVIHYYLNHVWLRHHDSHDIVHNLENVDFEPIPQTTEQKEVRDLMKHWGHEDDEICEGNVVYSVIKQMLDEGYIKI